MFALIASSGRKPSTWPSAWMTEARHNALKMVLEQGHDSLYNAALRDPTGLAWTSKNLPHYNLGTKIP